MQRLVLADSLLTGNPDIDQQHRDFVDLSNRILGLDGPALSDAETREALGFLQGYIHGHFLAEEEAMEGTAYPGRMVHGRFHEAGRKTFFKLVGAWPVSGASQAALTQLHYFVSDWFFQHILAEDKKLAAWLRDHAGPDAEGLPALKVQGAYDFDLSQIDQWRVVRPEPQPVRRSGWKYR